jgi:pyridoxine/pyridoxamine 5'-phosphate oxidase
MKGHACGLRRSPLIDLREWVSSLEKIRHHRLAVVATVSADNEPEAALVGFAITDQFELIFDTLDRTRKCQNLRASSKIAVVIGWDEEISIQYEGRADEPSGAELDRLKKVYYKVYPDGPARQQWPGITYFRIRPSWVRYSNFNDPVTIIEFSAEELK